MQSPERVLVWLLRATGALMLTALGAVIMPHHCMDTVHRWLGMGELPHVPIVGYLTRSLSGMYALHGALCVLVSLDVVRYLPVVRLLGVAGVIMGIVLLAVDRAVGMPGFWTILEGPPVVVFSVIILFLAGGLKAPAPGAGSVR